MSSTDNKCYQKCETLYKDESKINQCKQFCDSNDFLKDVVDDKILNYVFDSDDFKQFMYQSPEKSPEKSSGTKITEHNCYNQCKQQLCDVKDCQECQIIKNKEYKPFLTNTKCNNEIEQIKIRRNSLNEKYKRKCKYFDEESNCNNTFTPLFISESKSNNDIYNLFKKLVSSRSEIRLTTEQKQLINNIIQLKEEIDQLIKNSDQINLKIKKIFESDKIDLNTKLKEIIKILKITLLSIKKEYIPEPNIDIIINDKPDLKQTNLNEILFNIKNILIQKELNKNYKIVNLLLWIVDLYENKNLDFVKYYNFLSDIYIILQGYNEEYKTPIEIIQQILLLPTNEFIKIYDKKPSIENINQEQDSSIKKYNLLEDSKVINYNLSRYNFYNTGTNCFFSAALQLLYNINTFKSYIYDDEKIKEIFELKNSITNISDIMDNLTITGRYNSSFKLNINNIKEKLGIDLSKIKDKNDIKNNKDYNKILNIILIYYIRIIFKHMDKFIETEPEEHKDFRNKIIPFLRTLLKETNDEDKYNKGVCLKQIIISKSESDINTLNIMLKIREEQEDSSEYIIKILDYSNFNQIISSGDCKEKVYNNLISNYVNINRDETELKSGKSNINLDLIAYNSLNPDDENIDIYKLLNITYTETDIDNYKYMYNNVITYTRIKFNIIPNDLIFTINRSSIVGKLYNIVNVNIELNLNNYIINSINKDLKYKIKSIIVHNGDSISGHYYIYVRDKNDTWYKYNDTTSDNKRQPYSKIITDSLITFKNETVFVLHYERID